MVLGLDIVFFCKEKEDRNREQLTRTVYFIRLLPGRWQSKKKQALLQGEEPVFLGHYFFKKSRNYQLFCETIPPCRAITMCCTGKVALAAA